MEFFDQEFYEQTIRLDGNSFVNCQFEDCVLEYGGHMGVGLNSSTLKNCKLQLDGHAALTVQFLAAWRRGGEAMDLQVGVILAGIIADELPPPLLGET
jgi:hypothetical protein